ncbi:hypothetical protein [Parafilimonas sp.]|uniref:hypothetical protein n=1 Tax=Parafilimonas sp. TaxID=1969739 RepID=UPI0039E37094
MNCISNAADGLKALIKQHNNAYALAALASNLCPDNPFKMDILKKSAVQITRYA